MHFPLFTETKLNVLVPAPLSDHCWFARPWQVHWLTEAPFDVLAPATSRQSLSLTTLMRFVPESDSSTSSVVSCPKFAPHAVATPPSTIPTSSSLVFMIDSFPSRPLVVQPFVSAALRRRSASTDAVLRVPRPGSHQAARRSGGTASDQGRSEWPPDEKVINLFRDFELSEESCFERNFSVVAPGGASSRSPYPVEKSMTDASSFVALHLRRGAPLS